jgi:hypothetical protein
MIGKYQFLKITTTLGGFEAVPTKVEFLTQWGIWVRQFSNNSLHSLPESRILRSGCPEPWYGNSRFGRDASSALCLQLQFLSSLGDS